MTKSDVSWSDLAFLPSVRSALEVAVVGVVVHRHFVQHQRLPNELFFSYDNDILSSPPPSPPGYSADPLSGLGAPGTRARRRPSSVVVVGVGGGGGRRLSSCRPSHTGRRYRSSSSFLIW